MKKIILCIYLLIIGLFINGCIEDCTGMVGGNAVEDECGECNGDGCVHIYSVVSTPTDSESITLKNSYEETIDISGWTIGDINDPDSYNIPQNTFLSFGETKYFSHTTLNFQINDLNEIIYLKDSNGNSVDIWYD